VADSFYQGQVTFTCFSKQPVNAYHPAFTAMRDPLWRGGNGISLAEFGKCCKQRYIVVVARTPPQSMGWDLCICLWSDHREQARILTAEPTWAADVSEESGRDNE
ncbi:MAG: hypothetical protein ABGZ35_10315, partial [Planctomycetaceae bacterium]